MEKRNRNQKKQKQRIKQSYVVDTSVIIGGKLTKLIRKGLRGKLLIPNTVIAELENLANKGREEGLQGLDEIANLHELKKTHRFSLFFIGPRPSGHQIKYAKSGEIDALVRHLAYKNKATLITADIVQSKSARAYGIKVFFIEVPKPRPKKKKFRLFKRRRQQEQKLEINKFSL